MLRYIIMTKEKICERTDEKKYLKRKSPPMSATACPLGMVEKGNDGNKWQVVEVGKSQRGFNNFGLSIVQTVMEY